MENANYKGLSIGKKLEALLRKKRISVIQFAEMLGKSRTQGHLYLKTEDINTKNLREWSKVLNVPMSYWFLESWEENQSQIKEIEVLNSENELLRENQKSKDEIISFYKEKIEMLERQNEELKKK